VRVLALPITVFLLAGCGGETLTRESFRKDAESIESFAAEGAVLARDAEEGRTTGPFAAVHSDALAKSVGKVARKLEAADVGPELEQDRTRGARLAKVVENELALLHDNPRDSEIAGRVAAELEEDAKAAEELAG
jgi:hypothetical protein